ncbi:MAG: hypothetical protein ABIB43_05775 [archaeon]
MTNKKKMFKRASKNNKINLKQEDEYSKVIEYLNTHLEFSGKQSSSVFDKTMSKLSEYWPAAAGLTALMIATTAAPLAAEGISGFIKFSYDKDGQTKIVPQVDMFYKLPLKINGFTFIDFEDGGYFGKSNHTKTLIALDNEGTGNISAKVQSVHAGKPFATTGVGVEAKIPGLYDGLTMKAGYLPAWFVDGKHVDGKTVIDFYVKANLPKGFSIETFGSWGLSNGEATWAYGEVDLGKTFGQTKVSYNPQLLSDGDATPIVNHRAAVTFNF